MPECRTTRPDPRRSARRSSSRRAHRARRGEARSSFPGIFEGIGSRNEGGAFACERQDGPCCGSTGRTKPAAPDQCSPGERSPLARRLGGPGVTPSLRHRNHPKEISGATTTEVQDSFTRAAFAPPRAPSCRGEPCGAGSGRGGVPAVGFSGHERLRETRGAGGGTASQSGSTRVDGPERSAAASR